MAGTWMNFECVNCNAIRHGQIPPNGKITICSKCGHKQVVTPEDSIKVKLVKVV